MEFDFGNLIYIIATLVAILVGVLGKKKKPAGGAVPGGKEPKKRSGIFEVLGKEIEGYMEQNQVKQKLALDDELVVEPVNESVPDDYEMEEKEPDPKPVNQSIGAEYEGSLNPNREKNYDLLSSEAVSTTEKLQVIDLDEDKGRDYFEVLKEFDLESAVIYSAVINRIDY